MRKEGRRGAAPVVYMESIPLGIFAKVTVRVTVADDSHNSGGVTVVG